MRHCVSNKIFEFCVCDFCVLTFEQKLHIGRMSSNCIKYNIIRIPVFFISLHSFFLLPGICTFALDLFIEPSKRKITVPKTHNTKIKGEISQHKTQKSKHRSH